MAFYTTYTPYTAPLRINAQFSWLGCYVYSILHSSSLIILLISPLPWLWIAVLAVLVGLHGWHVLDYHLKLRNHPLQNCVLYSEEVKLAMHDFHQYAELHYDSFSSLWLVILRVRITELQAAQVLTKTHTLLLFPDSLDADTFRHLRVRIRLFKQPNH